MSSQVDVCRVGTQWDVRLDHRSVATYGSEATALEAAWDLAKRLGTWIVMSGDPAASCCSVRIIQRTFAGRLPPPSRDGPTTT